MTDFINPASLIPAGTIVPYLGGRQSTPPQGWLFCNGSFVNRNTYGDLFAAIGITYGSSSGTDFRLPTHSVLMRGGSSIALGAPSANHSHTFAFGMSGNITPGNNHTHGVNPPSTSDIGGSTHNHNQSINYTSGSNSGNFSAVSGSANFLAGDAHTHAVYHSYAAAGGAHAHLGTGGSVGEASSHSHSYNLTSANYSSNSAAALPVSMRLAYIIKT